MVEIISESTRSKDFVKKLDLYMSTGVKEYWVINPLNREVIVYFFENGDIVENRTFKNDEKALSYHRSGSRFETDLRIDEEERRKFFNCNQGR